MVPIAILIRRPSCSPTKAEETAPKNAPTMLISKFYWMLGRWMGDTSVPSKMATMTEMIVWDGVLNVLLKESVVTSK